MGYGVYEDYNARDWGATRWAGYGVPAFCDWDGCTATINRGLGYQCQVLDLDIDPDDMREKGCGLFFCDHHRYRVHEHDERAHPTPDTIFWALHMATDPSWKKWRDENPDQLAFIQDRVGR